MVVSLFLTTIDLQEAKGLIDEEDPRPTSSTWSYFKDTQRQSSKVERGEGNGET